MQLTDKLHKLKATDDNPEAEVVVNEDIVVGEVGESNLAEVPPPNVNMANYDETNEEDEAGAYSNARDIKIPFNKNDIKLWFSLVESKMQFAGIKKTVV